MHGGQVMRSWIRATLEGGRRSTGRRWSAVLSGVFSARPRRFGSTLLIKQRQPFPLARAISEALSEEEIDEFGDLEDWPGSVSELLEQNEIEELVLLSFYWDGLGPTSGEAGLVLLGNGRKRCVAYWDEIESYRALALLDPWDDPLAVSAVVKHVLGRNGAGFGIGLFGSLPAETTNDAPELIPRAVVRQAYFDLLQWWEGDRGSAWVDLAEAHFGRMVEPDHLQRTLDIVESLPSFAEAAAVGQWLDERDTESAAMSDHVRQRLFDEWFNGSYDEPTGGAHSTSALMRPAAATRARRTRPAPARA